MSGRRCCSIYYLNRVKKCIQAGTISNYTDESGPGILFLFDNKLHILVLWYSMHRSDPVVKSYVNYIQRKFNMKKLLIILAGFTLFFSSCDPDAPSAPSSPDAKSITSFVFTADSNDALTADAAGTISETSISVIVPDGVDLRSLTPEITYDAAAMHPGSLVARDFSSPASYILAAEDGTTSAYLVTVVHASDVDSMKSITSFIFKAVNNPTLPSDIAGTIGTSTVTATVGYGTDVGSLVPTIVHSGKSIVPVSESARSFWGPQSYTVTAGDNTTAVYTVNVTVGNPPGSVDLMETGQSASYAAGDDGDHKAGTAWPSPRFTDNGDGTLTDNATGLMWEKFVTNTARTWENAVSYCNNRIIDIYTDWRMPNVNELESLINYDNANQGVWLNSQGFSGVRTSSSVYFSSTTLKASPGNAFTMDTQGYGIYYTSKDNNGYVIAVRGTSTVIPATGQTSIYTATYGDDGDLQAGVAWPTPRFETSGNVIVDNLTGMIWEKAPSLSSAPWPDAVSAGNVLDLGGETDWRLANARELKSLINYGEVDSSLWLEDEGFDDIAATYYWCSTTLQGNTTSAYDIDMVNGLHNGQAKTVYYYVFHVRAGD